MICVILNKFRVNTSIEEFLWWCKTVTNYQEREISCPI